MLKKKSVIFEPSIFRCYSSSGEGFDTKVFFCLEASLQFSCDDDMEEMGGRLEHFILLEEMAWH